MERRFTRDGYTHPLGLAIRNFCGDTNPIEILLSHDASDINVRNSEGQTPLHLAARNQVCSVELVKLLVEHGAEVKATTPRDGNTALHWVASSCKSDRVAIGAAKILLEKGSDVNAVNNKGETALHLAVQNEFLCFDVTLTKVLRAHGADINLTDAKGETAYQAFCHLMKRYTREVDLVSRVLLMPMDEREQHKITPLHVACLCHKYKSVQKLLRIGADFNAIDSFGHSPLDYAVISPGDTDESTLKLLLDYGGDKIQDLKKSIKKWDIYHQYMAMNLSLNYVELEQSDDAEETTYMLVELKSAKEYKDWIARCSEELKTMRDTKIGDSKVSFLEFLIGDAKQTRICAKNKVLIEAFNVQKAMFPIYQGMLDAKMDRELERLRLIEEAAVALSNLLRFLNPSDEFFMRTLSYCSNRDLMRFIGEEYEM